MNRIRTIGRRIALFTGLVTTLLAAAGSVPAFASPAPPLNGGFGSVPASAGTPGWLIALIVVGSVAVAAAVVFALVHRARADRRQVSAPQPAAVPGR